MTLFHVPKNIFPPSFLDKIWRLLNFEVFVQTNVTTFDN